jgi:hypothetical protein
MKQLLSLSLFLILIPCFAFAQYPSNGNQKITLGEQTTADGLVYRGVAATDTVRKPSIDTMAYMVLDTTTNIMWHYKKATSNAWLRVGGSITSGLTGVLPLANGGTGSATQNFVDLTNTQTVGGAKTFSETITGARFNPTSSTASGTGIFLPKTSTVGFTTAGSTRFAIAPNGLSIFKSDTVQNKYTPSQMIEIGAQGVIFSETGAAGLFNDYSFGMGYYYDISGNTKYMATTNAALTHQPARVMLYQGEFLFDNAIAGTKDNLLTFTRLMTLNKNGNLGIGTTSPAVQFHTTSNVRFAGLVNYDPVETDADGDIIDGGASDFNLKNSIEPINYGLNCINQLKPVSYLWNDVNRKLDSTIPDIGFIAQDVMDVIPEAVRSNGDGDLQLNYKAITATLVKAIQEQNLLIKALEQRIINLENK